MRFKKINLPVFIFLIIYWVAAIFFIIFLLSLSVALIFYLRNGNEFYFHFLQESVYALRRAIPGGLILGSGLWLKSWLLERKNKKFTNK